MNPILFIGTYTQAEGHVNGKARGVYTYQMQPDGKLDSVSVFGNIANPSYVAVHPNGKLLYAVSENRVESVVVALKINEDFSLSEINRMSAKGAGPCYVSIHPNGQFAMIANYGSGNIVVFSLSPNGHLIEPVYKQQFEGEGPHSNQNKSHAHFISHHRNGGIYITDLGSDQIYQFDLKDSLMLKSQFNLPSGSGPRHLAFHPSLPILYCLNELAGTIQVVDIHEDGQLVAKQLISSIDPTIKGNASSADIVITPNGKYIYASNRGQHNSISAFKVNTDNGELELIDHYPSGGKAPRAITLSPDSNLLLVANQNTDNIFVYQINPSTGVLTHQGIDNQVLTPVCMKFLTKITD